MSLQNVCSKKNIYAERDSQKVILLHNIVNPSKHQDRPNVGAVPGQRRRPTLNQHRVDTLPANTGHQPNDGPMLALRPLRWPNIDPNAGRTSRAA